MRIEGLKDKNGAELVVTICVDKNFLNWVRCKLWKAKQVDLWLFKFNRNVKIHYSIKTVSELHEFVEEDYKRWANETIEAYNEKLTKIEKDAAVKDLIGC